MVKILNRMKEYVLILYFLGVSFTVKAQRDMWNLPLTEQLISQNKINYADHLESRKLQAVSTATVTQWQEFNSNLKRLHTQLENRTTQVFAVIADASTLVLVAQHFSNIAKWQKKTLEAFFESPVMVPFMIQAQIDLYKRAVDAYEYTNMIVFTFGDINKMSSASRQAIMYQLRAKLSYMEHIAYVYYEMAQSFVLSEKVKHSKAINYFKNDKDIVKEIIETWKK